MMLFNGLIIWIALNLMFVQSALKYLFRIEIQRMFCNWKLSVFMTKLCLHDMHFKLKTLNHNKVERYGTGHKTSLKKYFFFKL
jgi:hypothetical protein